MTKSPVDVWTISLTVSRAVILSPDEAARAARFHFEADCVSWSRARSALRAVLAGYAKRAPEDLAFDIGEHGKPALRGYADLQFNLSHAGDWALIAVSHVIPVGVDIERIRPKVDIAALLRRLGETDLPEGLPALYQAWTTREARSKAAGGALFDTPAAAIRVQALTAPEGYAAAVALHGADPEATYRGNL